MLCFSYDQTQQTCVLRVTGIITFFLFKIPYLNICVERQELSIKINNNFHCKNIRVIYLSIYLKVQQEPFLTILSLASYN